MATEETKPVEREAQELMETLHDLYGHTFDVLGEEAIKHKLQASVDAALESAAPDWFQYADKVAQKMGWPFTKLDELSEILRDEWRALKGSR